MDGAVARLRRKPARARVIVRSLDLGLNADALVTMVHDYTQVGCRAVRPGAGRPARPRPPGRAHAVVMQLSSSGWLSPSPRSACWKSSLSRGHRRTSGTTRRCTRCI